MGVPGDRPEINLELQPAGLRISWGPQKGPWGIFREDMIDHPVEVEIKEWFLFVNEILGHNPGGFIVRGDKIKEIKEHDERHMKPIFNKPVGTETTMMIQSEQLPKNKMVVVQVLGKFDSEKINGDPFEEGIYSDEVLIDLSKNTRHQWKV
jgi:hypothetical protein